MQETKVLSCISAEGGEAPGTVLSRGRSLSLVACRGLLLLLAPAGLGPEDSGVLSACCRVPSSFPSETVRLITQRGKISEHSAYLQTFAYKSASDCVIS